MKSSISFISIMMFSCLLFGQIKVYDSARTSNANAEGGIIYTLPKTKVQVEMVVKKSIFEKGDLYDFNWLIRNKIYLQKYLDFTSDSIVYRLHTADPLVIHLLKESDIVLKTIPIADYSKTYLIQVYKKMTKGSTVSLKLGEDNGLQSTEQTIENQTFEIITSGLAGVGKIISNLTGVFSGFTSQAQDSATRRRVATSSLTREDTLNILLGKLQELEKKEYNLKIGETAIQTPEILRELLDKTNNLRLEILALIAYSETTKVSNYFFDLIPDANSSNQDFRIFSFSEQNGVLVGPNASAEGKRYYSITTPGNVNGDSVYHISFNIDNNQNISTLAHAPTSKLEDYYRINLPSKANVKMYKGSSLVANTKSPFPQWGTIGYIKTKISKTAFTLDSFGALSSVTLERKASLSTDKVSSATDLADKLTKKKDKEQEEIDALTKKKTRLELQKQINELQNNQ